MSILNSKGGHKEVRLRQVLLSNVQYKLFRFGTIELTRRLWITIKNLKVEITYMYMEIQK